MKKHSILVVLLIAAAVSLLSLSVCASGKAANASDAADILSRVSESGESNTATGYDAALILRYCVGLIDDMPAVEPTATPEPEPETAGNRVLVACFSATGNTAPLAETVAELLGADLYTIVPADPYTEADLAYYTGGRCDQEQDDPDYRPAISGQVENMAQYDTVIIAHPTWHGQAPRIISTFLESYDFSGKTLTTFCTSQSSPLGSSAENLRRLVPKDVQWLESRRFASGASREELAEWLSDIGLLKQKETEEPMLTLRINDTPVTVQWESNESVAALMELVEKEPLTISMSMYGGFEQVGPIGQSLPRNDEQTTTSPGDIVLYSGNQIVVFYGPNSWSYTRLGRITDKTASEMAELLGNGDVKITIIME